MNDIPKSCPMCWSSSAWKRTEFPVSENGYTEGVSPMPPLKPPIPKVTYCCQRCGYSMAIPIEINMEKND